MNNILYIIQSVIALFLIGLIVIQAKGTGLGRSFASSNYHAKRGMEKNCFCPNHCLSPHFLGPISHNRILKTCSKLRVDIIGSPRFSSKSTQALSSNQLGSF